MEHTSKYDYLIIGQGLAGSILANQLIQRGRRVCVIDNHHHRSSSSVAAGIINPVTGHRLNITSRFDEFYPVAKSYYLWLGEELNQSFWSSIEQQRLIKNAGQSDYFQQRLKQPEYQSIFSLEQPQDIYFKYSNFGLCEVNKSASVNCNALLKSVRNWLIDKQSLMDTVFDYSGIRQTTEGFDYQDISTKRLIFCEGHQAIHNPWLQQLPFKLSKGVVLDVETDPSVEIMLNWGNWLVPNGKYNKLGSSYEWHELSFDPDYETESKLVDSVHKNTHIKAKVKRHMVGIRPTTEGRTPFVGALSKLSNAFCFNGFGSKGCLLIPYYAELLCDHLLSGKAIPQELNKCL